MTETFDFDDWGSYRLLDLYDAPKAALEKALKSGRKFESGWHRFKKAIASMRVLRDENGVKVDCSAIMDSCPALIDDCLTSEEMGRMTDEMYDKIESELYGGFISFSCHAFKHSQYMNNPSLDDVINTARKLLDECELELDGSFASCISATLSVLYEGEPKEKVEEIIVKRIKQLVGEEKVEEIV